MAHSYSLPFTEFLVKKETKDGQEYTVFKSIPEIRAVLDEALSPERAEEMIRGEKHAITTCGSGMTAGVLWLGLSLLKAPHVSLYDEVCYLSFLERTTIHGIYCSRGWAGLCGPQVKSFQKSECNHVSRPFYRRVFTYHSD